MPMLDDILQGDRQPGLYQFNSPIDLDAFSAQTQEQGWMFFYLAGEAITNKQTFLDACARTMHFPAYFGHNWDALEECLADPTLGFGTKSILLYNQPEKFAENEPSQWAIAVHILQTTVDYWREKEVPLYVLFKTDRLAMTELEVLEDQ